MRCEDVEYSLDALKRLGERALDPAVVADALRHPEWTEPDPDRPPLIRAFVNVPGASSPLRIVVGLMDNGRCFVVTLFPDRRANRRRLR